ncbi:MAG: hypothetical protein CL916_08875 [Deltaproteobacteria bacterium]|nr:hypothetical protein [Deltaproteobacteria bacterium]
MRIEKLSRQRTFIYHLLRRAVRFHAPICVTCLFDITDLEAKIKQEREKGVSVGLVASFIKATALCIQKHERLNQRLFHTFWGTPKIATFDEISCNTVVSRTTKDGEDIVLPMVLRHVDTMSVSQIQAKIRAYKSKPLHELEAVSNLNKISNMPRWLSKFLHWRFRREPRFLISKVGTYAVSALPTRDLRCTSSLTPVSQTAFIPTTIQEEMLIIDGQPKVRTTMTCSITVDHYVMDGLYLKNALIDLRTWIEDPDTLFEQ